ncbi:MAG: heavy-metal-associated domain-containing protein, partial [Anaerolineales bacterium]|nr:heavy-metal-associated domain-containing protein [Anaerolineales bacterium]
NKTYRVEGMHCPNCAMNVESIEDDLPGIKQVSASYQKGQMVVEFDEAKVSEAQILIESALRFRLGERPDNVEQSARPPCFAS